MSRVKHSHIVPEFYLNYFTDSHDKIYVFDKPNFDYFESKPNKIAKQSGFYDLDGVSDIGLKQIIETKLSSIEDETAPVYKNLIDRINLGIFNGLLEEERLVLSRFIVVQMMRTARSRIMFDQFNTELDQQLKEKTSEKDYNQLNKELGVGDFNPKILQISMLASTFEEQSFDLSSRIWIIYKNNTRSKFCTSDHPVCTFNHGDVFNMQHEIFFPLTPDYMLSLLEKRQLPDFISYDNKIIEAEEEDILQWYNCVIIFIAKRQVYSSNSDFTFTKKVLTENPKYR